MTTRSLTAPARAKLLARASAGSLVLLAFGSVAQAQTADGAGATVSEVVVTGARGAGAAQSFGPNPVATISNEGLTVFAGPGQTSAFQAANVLPGVIGDTADPYGLSLTRALNVRGKSDFFLDETVNGLPAAGIVGGTTDLFDVENVQSERVFVGPLLANQGFGVADASGALDETLIAPDAARGGVISQSFGSDDFRRTFLRLGTGELSTGTAVWVSGSTSQADNWKGAGDAWRNNISVGVSQKIGDQLTLTLDYAHNVQKANNYAPLSYTQVQHLSQDYDFTYPTSPTGLPAASRNQYYALNLQKFTDDVVLANAKYQISPTSTLTFSPYYWHDVGFNNLDAGQDIRNWLQNKDNYGFALVYDTQLTRALKLSAGYWFQSMSADPPPVSQKNYTVTAQGQLQFAGWATLGRFSRQQFNTPFLQLTYDQPDWSLTGGLRYQIESSPDMSYVLTKGLPNVSPNAALALNPALDPNGQVSARTFYEPLPNLGLRRRLTSDLTLDLSYGRKIARVDYGPQASSFFGAESAFVNEGITLKTLMNQLRPEIDDEVDAALDFVHGPWSVTPDFYFYKARDKEVLVEDPAVGQSFYQSNASTTGYGLDLSVGYRLSNNLSAFVTATLSKETYDNNILLAGSTTPTIFAIAGKQVPNDPQGTVKAALSYKIDNLTISPVIQYIGSRYGLANDSQSVKGYVLTNLDLAYDLGPVTRVKGLTARLSIQNLFDVKYIGVISVNEDDLNTTNYYAGAPLTIAGSLSLRF